MLNASSGRFFLAKRESFGLKVFGIGTVFTFDFEIKPKYLIFSEGFVFGIGIILVVSSFLKALLKTLSFLGLKDSGFVCEKANTGISRNRNIIFFIKEIGLIQ